MAARDRAVASSWQKAAQFRAWDPSRQVDRFGDISKSFASICRDEARLVGDAAAKSASSALRAAFTNRLS
jgi:hypothetical protein